MTTKTNSCINIAGIYYPKRKTICKSNAQLHYEFSFDTDTNLELKVTGIPKYRYLYADENQYISKIRTNTFTISYDEGDSWGKEKSIDDLDISQIYLLSNGNYLIGGVNLLDRTQALIYTLDKNLNILAKNNICKMTWHSQDAIGENDSVVMFAEYENSSVEPPEKVSIFRSKDFGLTWEEVFSLKHPSELKHWHTLQKDPYRPNHWLATGGDTPEQSRWFLSKDNGDNWQEITDTNHYNEASPAYSLSAHRTTAIKITKDYYYFSTDDLMGGAREYFLDYKKRRQSSSKFYRAKKTEPIKIEYLSNIGIHGRSMIDTGQGYIIITEGKYATFNTQVYYISKDNLKKVYFLFDIYGNKRHPGSASKNSKLLYNRYFYTPITKGLFFDNPDAITLKWDVTYKDSEETIEYDIAEYIKLEEHLWFVSNTKNLDAITFMGNSVNIKLKKSENIFYLLLGDSRVHWLSSKKLFTLKEDESIIEISFSAYNINKVSIDCFVQLYDESKKIFSKSYSVTSGLNNIQLTKRSQDNYIKILFKVKSKVKTEFRLSDLSIKLTNKSKELPSIGLNEIDTYLKSLKKSSKDTENIQSLTKQTQIKIVKAFNEQFFKEGIHKENSSQYHYFALEIFEKNLNKELFSNAKEMLETLENAKRNCAYMHFPNNESLMTGDSNFEIIKPRKEEKMKEGISYFNESGYTYIYEENDTPSMLFFDTAFLSNKHKHADFFNILLYEYGKNILVDAGKYSDIGNNPFRRYCISTCAHNTVLIDNEDYKLDKKYFFTSKIIKKQKTKNYYVLSTSHYYDYSKTYHDRHIFYKPSEFLCIVDVLISDEDKNFKQLFHLHEDLEISKQGDLFQTDISEDVVMNINVKSLDIHENKIYSNTELSKGLDGKIEGYRALGHHEIIENYVLVNETKGRKVVLGSLFTFNKQPTFNMKYIKQGILQIEFDKYKTIIDNKKIISEEK